MSFIGWRTTAEDSSPRVSMIAHMGKADGDSGKLTVSDVKHGQHPAFEIVISL